MTTEWGFWPPLILAILATWRITHLLVNEDGPFDAVVRLRAWLGDGGLGRAMDCFHCMSLWVAAPLAVFVARGSTLDALVAWMGLSGAACLIERVTGAQPILLQGGALPEGGHDGMLRPGTGSAEGADSEGEPGASRRRGAAGSVGAGRIERRDD